MGWTNHKEVRKQQKDYDNGSLDRKKPIILVADDSPEVIALVKEALKDEARILAAKNASLFRQAYSTMNPDLVLLDVRFGTDDGLDILSSLPKDGPPVIIMTAPDDIVEADSLDLGAIDFFSKPLRTRVVKSRVLAHCSHVARNADRLDGILRKASEAVVMAMVRISCLRDNETGNHLLRTQSYLRMTAEEMVASGTAFLSSEMIDMYVRCAPLHDIGKVGIPDHILLKPGKFEPDEWTIMQTHAQIGADAIMNEAGDNPDLAPFFKVAVELIGGHHEKWDGSGYPKKLAGKDIPLPARLMAIADVYDALRSSRPYKKAFSHEQALKIIQNGRGTHFDPDVLDAFMRREADMLKVSIDLADEDTFIGDQKVSKGE